MSVKPIYVTQPFLPPLEEYTPYLEQIWANKILTNGGPMHRELEGKLANYLGVDQFALFNNGTIALVTAVQVLGLTGEVITTPYSFVATAHAIAWNGLEPVFVDVDPTTLNIDPARIEAAITPRTSAILPVHCYGNPCDVEAIEDIARRHGLKVIYDAAHAFGVHYRGRSLLSWGDLSVLSFHATKVYNTFEGGGVTCHDEQTKLRIERLKNFGIESETEINQAGLNGKMNEMQAAMGLLQLGYVDGAITRRGEIDRFYRDALSQIDGLDPVAIVPQTTPNYSYFPVLVGASYPLSRDQLEAKMRATGVFGRKYFFPLISEFPVYRNVASSGANNLPVATDAARRVLCLPLYPDLSEDDLARIVALLR